jgi:hypothetical protein
MILVVPPPKPQPGPASSRSPPGMGKGVVAAVGMRMGALAAVGMEGCDASALPHPCNSPWWEGRLHDVRSRESTPSPMLGGRRAHRAVVAFPARGHELLGPRVPRPPSRVASSRAPHPSCSSRDLEGCGGCLPPHA